MTSSFVAGGNLIRSEVPGDTRTMCRKDQVFVVLACPLAEQCCCHDIRTKSQMFKAAFETSHVPITKRNHSSNFIVSNKRSKVQLNEQTQTIEWFLCRDAKGSPKVRFRFCVAFQQFCTLHTGSVQSFESTGLLFLNISLGMISRLEVGQDYSMDENQMRSPKNREAGV